MPNSSAPERTQAAASRCLFLRFTGFIATAICIAMLCLSLPSWAQSPPAKPAKPDLHAGGPSPSEIPNGETTEVVLPGYHLTGAHVDARPICTIESYQVTSDSEIRMKIKASRTIDDKDGACYLTIRTPGGTANAWVMVDFTESERADFDARQRAEERQKASMFVDRSGKSWHLTFAAGQQETYTATGADPDGMPSFQSSSGVSVKIAVSNTNKITIIDSGCIRTGSVAGNEVKNGQSMGQCDPAGSWTATVER
jgi:hypothetical protein